MTSERAKRQLAEVQSRGFRVGYTAEAGGAWTATALFDDHPMYVGVGDTKEAALEDLHRQVMTSAKRRTASDLATC